MLAHDRSRIDLISQSDHYSELDDYFSQPTARLHELQESMGVCSETIELLVNPYIDTIDELERGSQRYNQSGLERECPELRQSLHATKVLPELALCEQIFKRQKQALFEEYTDKIKHSLAIGKLEQFLWPIYPDNFSFSRFNEPVAREFDFNHILYCLCHYRVAIELARLVNDPDRIAEDVYIPVVLVPVDQAVYDAWYFAIRGDAKNGWFSSIFERHQHSQRFVYLEEFLKYTTADPRSRISELNQIIVRKAMSGDDLIRAEEIFSLTQISR
ncbi:hypothetical protein [Thalassoporum mexicanum]|uniref:hypothetical protein n=1 Tax=Thalassoporum mexicanum TaxID=3457544 RepID=UPI0012EA96DC|nr:hypothetical protein [Pseudanabaena sp. PCC 7367]